MDDTYDGAQFLYFKDSFTDDASYEKMIREDWNKLLNDEDPVIRDLFRALIIYAFFTSNDTAGYSRFFKFVPVQWRLNGEEEYGSYSEYCMQNKDYDLS